MNNVVNTVCWGKLECLRPIGPLLGTGSFLSVCRLYVWCRVLQLACCSVTSSLLLYSFSIFLSLSLPTIARLPALYFYTPYFLSLSFSFPLSFHSPFTHRSHIILLFLPFILPTDSFISASHSFKTFSVSAPKDREPRSAIIVLHWLT